MPSFTACESEIMTILWEHGEQKPSEIQDRHPRDIKNAALRFQLKILLEKGHVSRCKVGKAYYYRAVTRREGAFKKMVRRMADMYCQGSAVGLIAELIKSERLSDEDIQALKQLAEDKRIGKSKRKGGKRL
jgi:BlaI family transcriptional regulator, penicillinase repressor